MNKSGIPKSGRDIGIYDFGRCCVRGFYNLPFDRRDQRSAIRMA